VQEVTAIPSRSFFRFMGDPGKHLKNEIRFGNKPSGKIVFMFIL